MNRRVSFPFFNVATRLALGLFCIAAGPAYATDDAPATEDFSVHGQTTWVWQHQRGFRSPYAGAHSLRGDAARSYSFTATAAFAARVLPSTELYADAEAAQGVPLSDLTGLGGFTNGEMARTSGPRMVAYRARLFVRHTIGLGGGADAVEGDLHQLAGLQDRRRVVITAGNLAVGDLFDDNAYAHDPRTQFLNWSLMAQGAYDFAADARGYTRGVALAWHDGEWAVRWGRFMQPVEPNGQALDPHLGRHRGDQFEVERGWSLGDALEGRLRVLAFDNRARMGRYADAIALGAATGTVPDLGAVRREGQHKRGWGLNLEQALSEDWGVFARLGRSDGRTETYAFTEIDRSASAGAVLRGASWGRAQDALGLAVAQHGLSRSHRDYLAAGGLGFFLGDGQLRYARETVYEAFYAFRLRESTQLALDWQHIRRPGYNADRGPVNVASVRVHAEF